VPKKYLLPLFAITFFLIDQVSKIFLQKLLATQSFIWFFKPIFGLTLVFNRGAAFGIFQGKVFFLILISLFVFGLLFFIYKQEPNKSTFLLLSFGLIIGGAVGNLFDRVFSGYVVDFIYLSFWPTFNFADIFINAGVGGPAPTFSSLFKKSKTLILAFTCKKTI